MFGADATQANLGVAELLVKALQKRGLSEAAAVSRIWMVDSKGLITAGRPNLTPQKAAFAQDPSRLKGRLPAYSSSGSSSNGSGRRRPSKSEVIQQLTVIVEAVRPTALIGAAAVGGAFGRPVLEALTKVNRVRAVRAASWHGLQVREAVSETAVRFIHGNFQLQFPVIAVCLCSSAAPTKPWHRPRQGSHKQAVQSSSSCQGVQCWGVLAGHKVDRRTLQQAPGLCSVKPNRPSRSVL
jgi:hypothetical protein